MFLYDLCPGKSTNSHWLVLHGVVPSNTHHFYCNIGVSPTCTRCTHPSEDIFYCLRDFPHSKEVWIRPGCDLFPQFFTFDTLDWMTAIIEHSDSVRFLPNLWWIWWWRNKMLDCEVRSLHFVQRNILYDISTPVPQVFGMCLWRACLNGTRTGVSIEAHRL